MNNFLEYQKRQSVIDQSLTPQLVKQILLDNHNKIKAGLQKPDNRLIIITFASTAALVRIIESSQSGNGLPASQDRPLSIDFTTIEEGRKMNPQSQVLHNCDPATQFCVIIATLFPLSALGLGPDKIFTHTTTCLTLNSIEK